MDLGCTELQNTYYTFTSYLHYVFQFLPKLCNGLLMERECKLLIYVGDIMLSWSIQPHYNKVLRPEACEKRPYGKHVAYYAVNVLV
jgi:hypothetical protein